MSIVWADNFSIYGTDESLLLDGVYVEVRSPGSSFGARLDPDPDGISPGTVLRIGTGSDNTSATILRYALPAGSATTSGILFRIWVAPLPTDNTATPIPVSIRGPGNFQIAELRVLTNGALRMQITGGASYDTATPVITANGWYHIEVKYTHSGLSLCSFEVRVEGITVLSQTDVTGPDLDTVQIAVVNSNNFTALGVPYYIKDYVIWDGTGSENNDFLGSVLVTRLSTVADVSLNWVPSIGTTGYDILDNVPPIDTDYIYADNTLPAAYVGELSDLPMDVTSVKALMPIVRASKSDGGDGTLQNGIISDPNGAPATVFGSDRPITTSPTYWYDVFETDPKTAAPWLPSSVNDANIQIDRTT